METQTRWCGEVCIVGPVPGLCRDSNRVLIRGARVYVVPKNYTTHSKASRWIRRGWLGIHRGYIRVRYRLPPASFGPRKVDGWGEQEGGKRGAWSLGPA